MLKKIYPIRDNVLVSLLQYVPNKSGMIMVANEKYELILSAFKDGVDEGFCWKGLRYLIIKLILNS